MVYWDVTGGRIVDQFRIIYREFLTISSKISEILL